MAFFHEDTAAAATAQTKRVQDAAPHLPGHFSVDWSRNGTWRVVYWWGNTRTVVRGKATPEAAADAAIAKIAKWDAGNGDYQ